MTNLPTDFSQLSDEEILELEELLREEETQRRKSPISYYEPLPGQVKFHSSSKRIRILQGGNRCLAGETEIYDPVLDYFRRVDEIDGDFHVLSADSEVHVAKANRPFSKAPQDLWEFTLSSGESFRGTLTHQVFCDDGRFHTIACVLLSSFSILPETTWEIFREAHAAGGPHVLWKILKSVACCRSLPLSYKRSLRLIQVDSSSKSSFIADPLDLIDSSGITLHAGMRPGTGLLISSFRWLRQDVVWDFEVPFYHNYVLSGVIHHNSGKSTAGACEAGAHILGHRPWLPEDHPDYRVKNALGDKIRIPSIGTVLGESYKIAVDRVLHPTLMRWLPPDFVTRAPRNQQGVVDSMEFANGSKLRFMTYNQAPKEFEGFAADWAWYDEPPPEDVFVANERSLVDRSGRSWFTMTPLRQPWIWENLVSKEGEDKKIEVFYMHSYDNVHLPKESLDEYFSRIGDPAEREARAKGVPFFASGRIFSQFQPKAPYFVEYFEPEPHWIRVMGIDPHPQKPVACLWVAISPDSGIWYPYRELFDPSLITVRAVAREIKRFETNEGEHIALRIIDSSSRESEKTSGSSVYDQFEDEGILCEIAQKHDLLGRIEILKRKLEIDPIHQVPGVVVMDTCPRLKYEFMTYVWKDHSVALRGRMRGEMRPEPRKKDDDMLSDLMYLLQWGEEPEDFSRDVMRPRFDRYFWERSRKHVA